MQLKRKKRGRFISISLSVYDMSRKGEHIKCMTHKSVCAAVPHQRPAERVASTAAGGIQKKRQFRALLGVVIQLVTQNMWLSRCMPICFCSWWMFYPRENLHKYVAKLSDEILYLECNSFCALH